MCDLHGWELTLATDDAGSITFGSVATLSFNIQMGLGAKVYLPDMGLVLEASVASAAIPSAVCLKSRLVHRLHMILMVI